MATGVTLQQATSLAKALGASPTQLSGVSSAYASQPQSPTPSIGGAVTASGQQLSGSGQVVGTAPQIDVIKPSSLTNTQAINLPSTSILNQSAVDILKNLNLAYNPQTTAQTSTQGINTVDNTNTQGVSDLLALELGLRQQNPIVQTEPIYSKLYNEGQIAQKQQLVNTYTNQLNAIETKKNADILSLTGQGRGIPEVIIGGQQAQVQKEAAINALPIAAQLSAAQGDLATAQQHLDTMFKIQVADAQAKYDFNTKLIDSVVSYATKSEQRKFDLLQKKNEQDFTISRDNAATLNSLGNKALQYHPELLPFIYSIDKNSPTFNSEVANLALKVNSIGTTSSFTDIMQQSVNAGATAEQAAREAATASMNAGITVNQDTLNSWTDIAKKMIPVSNPEQTTQTQQLPKIEQDIETLRNYFSNVKDLPSSVNVENEIKSILQSRYGYTEKQVRDSSVGSAVDQFITSVADFLFK